MKMRKNKKENEAMRMKMIEYINCLPTMMMINEQTEKGKETGKEEDDDGNNEIGSYEDNHQIIIMRIEKTVGEDQYVPADFHPFYRLTPP